jgi:hypothetical protein
MTSFTKFQLFVDDLVAKAHNFKSDTFKVMLSNTLPVAATAHVTGDITEISAGNGYSAGGPTTALTVTNTAGVEKVVAANAVVTATGAIGPFQYACVYNSTASKLVGFFDYGSAVTLANTDTFTVVFDSTNGLFQIS